MRNSLDYDLIIIGNYSRDTIINNSETIFADGGGFYFASYVAKMMGVKTAAITRLSTTHNYIFEELTACGINVFPTYTKYSTEMKLVYSNANIDDRQITVTNNAGSFSNEQISGMNAKTFIISALLKGEIEIDFLQEIKKRETTLAADVQGFMRVAQDDGRLVNDRWSEKQQFLSEIDILKTDAIEAEILTGIKNKNEAARMLSDWGPKEIIMTHSKGILVYANGQFYETEFYSEKMVGRTGRGDTCFTSYLGKRLTSSPLEAIHWAGAVTSLKMESAGPIKKNIDDVKAYYYKNFKSRGAN